MPVTSRPASGEELRVIGAALLVAGLALFASLDSYSISSRLSERSPDIYGAAKAHLRFAPALPLLPAAGKVTYLSDLKFDDGSGTAAFLTAQNALAPRVLVMPDPAHPTAFAISQFSKALDYDGFGQTHGYELVRDLGNGVILYRRK
jgi:hypothetical protein